MSSQTVEEFDLVVVGGGPGGSTLASLVAMQGHRVLVLEKEKFPRYQIGESLLPATVHGVCRLTGAAETLSRAGFTLKRGGTFQWGANPDPWTFSFAVSPRMAGPTSFAYQVERTKFDQILLDNARRLGAEVREKCLVTDITEEDERVRGVRYRTADGNECHALAKYVADASGNKSRIYQNVGGVRQYSEFFRNLALFGYFEGGKRLPEPNAGNIMCVAFNSGWFWYIPLSVTLTSVGAVVRRELAGQVRGDPEQVLRRLIRECPVIEDYLSDAERITSGDYGRLRMRKDYSYHQTRFWRPGMVLVGDAACFVDPVFSSGVHLATYSALLAARSINSVLAGMLEEQVAFREFEARYRREYSVFYEFLMSFYDIHMSNESYFWEAKKITRNSRPELEAFVELVGGVASGEAALTDAETAAQRFRTQSGELAAAVQEVAGARDGRMSPLLRSPVISAALREGTLVKASAAQRVDEPTAEEPLFTNGLVPSGDSMFWMIPGGGGDDQSPGARSRSVVSWPDGDR